MQFKIDSFSFDPCAVVWWPQYAYDSHLKYISWVLRRWLHYRYEKIRENRIEMAKKDRSLGKRVNETEETENARGCVNDIAGMSKRLGARVIWVITAQLHYLINPGGRSSRQLPRCGGRDCLTRGAITIIIV